MSDRPVHLEPVKTDRGFSHLPPIADGYGSSIHVYESSAADGPYVWVKIRNDVQSDKVAQHESLKINYMELCAHLAMEDLVKLGEQIEWMKQHHYQGAWEDEIKQSWWSRLVARLRGSDEE